MNNNYNNGYNNNNNYNNSGYNNVNNSNNNNYNSYNGGNKNDNNSLSGKQAAKAYLIIFLIAGILLFIYFSDSDDKKKTESSNVNETVSNSNIQQTPTSNIPQSVPSNKPSNQAPVASNKTSNKAPVTSNKTSNKAPATSNKTSNKAPVTSNKAPVNTGEIKISKLAFIDYVQNSEVWVNDTLDISEFLMVVPENANAKGITYKSSNTSVATVDNNGNVKALKVGNVKITATAPSGASATLSLKVVSKPPMEFFVNGSGSSISYGDLTLNIIAISNESCISNNSCSGQIEIDIETGDWFYSVKTNTGKHIIDETNYLMEPITKDGQIIIKVYEAA